LTRNWRVWLCLSCWLCYDLFMFVAVFSESSYIYILFQLNLKKCFRLVNDNGFESFGFLYWQYSSPLHGKIWSCLRPLSFHFHFFVWQTKLCTLVTIRSQSAPMEWCPKKHGHHDMALFPLVLYNCASSSGPHDLLVHTYRTQNPGIAYLQYKSYSMNLNMLHLFGRLSVQCLWREKIHTVCILPSQLCFSSGHQKVK